MATAMWHLPTRQLPMHGVLKMTWMLRMAKTHQPHQQRSLMPHSRMSRSTAWRRPTLQKALGLLTGATRLQNPRTKILRIRTLHLVSLRRQTLRLSLQRLTRGGSRTMTTPRTIPGKQRSNHSWSAMIAENPLCKLLSNSTAERLTASHCLLRDHLRPPRPQGRQSCSTPLRKRRRKRATLQNRSRNQMRGDSRRAPALPRQTKSNGSLPFLQ